MSRARDFADLAGSADAGGLTGRNLIINGNMSVAQRGASSTSAGINSVDRWNAAFGGSGAAVTQSKESLASSDAPYALGLRNYFRSTVTGQSTDTAAYHQILQYVEAQNMAQSGWNLTSTSSFITLSFWVRSSLAGTYAFYVESMDGTPQAYSHSFTLSANTWTKVTETMPGNSNITINNDNGQGLLVDIVAHFGTNYTTSSSTEDAWKQFDTTDVFKDYGQNWLNTSSATFDVTGVQLEVGTATPFEHEDFGTTFRKCQRYFELLGHAMEGTSDGFSLMSLPFNGATGNQWIDIPFMVEKRAAPTSIVAFNGYTLPTTSGIGFSTNGMTLYHTSQMLFTKSGGSSGDAVASVSAEL
tara:strand:+ start:29 stop:1099 length:1071 start_codon:yes stop_codon:yes gene_type:complete